jgi:hypothetical protein
MLFPLRVSILDFRGSAAHDVDEESTECAERVGIREPFLVPFALVLLTGRFVAGA